MPLMLMRTEIYYINTPVLLNKVKILTPTSYVVEVCFKLVNSARLIDSLPRQHFAGHFDSGGKRIAG